MNNYVKPTLLQNQVDTLKNSNNWLHVKLIGANENRYAVGAKIQLKTADATQIREIYAGESYMSSNSYVAEFGIGKATQIKMLKVIWTNGKTQSLQNITANQLVQISQD